MTMLFKSVSAIPSRKAFAFANAANARTKWIVFTRLYAKMVHPSNQDSGNSHPQTCLVQTTDITILTKPCRAVGRKKCKVFSIANFEHRQIIRRRTVPGQSNDGVTLLRFHTFWWGSCQILHGYNRDTQGCNAEWTTWYRTNNVNDKKIIIPFVSRAQAASHSAIGKMTITAMHRVTVRWGAWRMSRISQYPPETPLYYTPYSRINLYARQKFTKFHSELL